MQQPLMLHTDVVLMISKKRGRVHSDQSMLGHSKGAGTP